MTVAVRPGPVFAPERDADGITLLLIAPERSAPSDRADAISSGGRLDVRAEPDPVAAIEHLGDVDCMVAAHAPGSLDAVALLEAVRERDETLPFVLWPTGPDGTVRLDEPAEVTERLRADEWTAVVERDSSPPVDRVRRRVRRFVGRRRLLEAVRRELVGIDLDEGGVAVVAPDGTVAFADRTHATLFGTDPASIVGTDWRRWYADEGVRRLQHAAIPAAAEGWRWAGVCPGTRADGETVRLQLHLVGLAGGRVAFVAAAV